MRFLSLFAGIGGMDLGLERAGMTCVGQCELDPFCRRVLEKHWPGVWRHDDVRTLDYSAAPQFDYVVAGFPCQDVSNAGLRAGVSAPRSGLYREVVRCLRVVRPIGAVLENVAALLVRGMGEVVGDLAELGYDVQWLCLSSADFGAIHIRERVFLVATLRGHPQPAVPPREVLAHTGRERLAWFQHKPRHPAATNLVESVGAVGTAVRAKRGRGHGARNGPAVRMDRIRGVGNAVDTRVAEYIGGLIMKQPRGEGGRC